MNEQITRWNCKLFFFRSFTREMRRRRRRKYLRKRLRNQFKLCAMVKSVHLYCLYRLSFILSCRRWRRAQCINFAFAVWRLDEASVYFLWLDFCFVRSLPMRKKCEQNRRILLECQFVSEHLLYRLKFKQITEFFFAQQNASLFIDWNLMGFPGHRIYWKSRIQRNYVAPNPILAFVECRVSDSWNAFSLTCFNSRSLFADKHVTKYLVRLKNEPSTSKVRWSREERCNINDITKNPRFCEWNRAQHIHISFNWIRMEIGLHPSWVFFRLPESYAAEPFANSRPIHK